MKKINYILFLLLIVGCSSTRDLTDDFSKLNNFVFKKSIVFSKNGIENLKSKQDSLGIKLPSENMLTDFITKTPDTEIHIQIKNDSIWRHTEEKGKMIGDYLMILKDNGVLNYYDKSKAINYKKYDLFSKNDKYRIIENKKDRKKVRDLDCYKLKIIREDVESDLGNTIYEMYVTNQIELPVHSVINITKLIPNTFPIEIKIREEKSSGIIEIYELIEIN